MIHGWPAPVSCSCSSSTRSAHSRPSSAARSTGLDGTAAAVERRRARRHRALPRPRDRRACRPVPADRGRTTSDSTRTACHTKPEALRPECWTGFAGRQRRPGGRRPCSTWPPTRSPSGWSRRSARDPAVAVAGARPSWTIQTLFRTLVADRRAGRRAEQRRRHPAAGAGCRCATGIPGGVPVMRYPSAEDYMKAVQRPEPVHHRRASARGARRPSGVPDPEPGHPAPARWSSRRWRGGDGAGAAVLHPGRQLERATGTPRCTTTSPRRGLAEVGGHAAVGERRRSRVNGRTWPVVSHAMGRRTHAQQVRRGSG